MTVEAMSSIAEKVSFAMITVKSSCMPCNFVIRSSCSLESKLSRFMIFAAISRCFFMAACFSWISGAAAM